MRRDKTIAVYLEKHPRATEKELRRKFGLSRRETLIFLGDEQPLGIVSQQSGWRVKLGGFLGAWFAGDKKTVLTLVGVAFLVRAGYAYSLWHNPLLTTSLHDAAYYVEWAKNILTHGWIGDKVFFTEPLYAYLLALFLKLFGDGGTTALLVGQFLLGALLPLPLFILTKRLINRRAAMITGLLAALYGPFLFYEGLLLKTSLEVSLLPWAILLFLAAFRARSERLFFWAGIVLGGLALVKGNNIIFLPVIIGLVFFLLRESTVRRRAVLAALFSLGVLVCLLPVTIRNFVVGHDIVPTNYSFGLAIYQGSWWGADGSTAEVPRFLRPDPQYEEADAVGMAQAYVGKTLLPSEVSRFWIAKSVEETLSAPLHFVGTVFNKSVLIFNHSEFSDNYQYSFYRSHIPWLWLLPSFWLVAVFGLSGVWLFFRPVFWAVSQGRTTQVSGSSGWPESARVFVGLFLSAIAVLLLTTVNARYRMPLVPFLLVFSGGSISFLWSLWQEREWSSIIRLGVFGGACFLLAAWPLTSVKHDSEANAYHALAFTALKQGDYAQAEDLLNKTIAIDGQYGWAYGNLMLTELALGHYDAAQKALQRLIMLRPDDLSNYDRLKMLRQLQGASPEVMRQAVRDFLSLSDVPDYDADFNEATRYLYLKDDQRAEAALVRSLEQHNQPVSTLIALASLKKNQGDTRAAKEYLTMVVDQHPEIFLARYNLANLFIQENNFFPVASLLKDIYEFTPELSATWYNYAVALIKTKKDSEAIPVMQAYIERYQDDPAHQDVVEKFRAALKPAGQDPLQNLLPGGKK